MFVVDLSHHNVIKDWKLLAKEVDGVILRSSYGSNGIDRKFGQNLMMCKAIGIKVVGTYHFYYANTTASENSYNALAGYYDAVSILGYSPEYLMVDFEYDSETKRMSSTERLIYLREALESLETKRELNVGLYINSDYENNRLDLSILREYYDCLWYARLNRVMDSIEIGVNKTVCVLQQYSHTGHLSSINGNVDFNIYDENGIINRTLRRGMKSVDVGRLQLLLNITIDNIFGVQTETAVKAYQRSHGLKIDGIAGWNTLKSLYGGK